MARDLAGRGVRQLVNLTNSPIVGVVGCGVVGTRVVRHLLRADVRVAVHDPLVGGRVPGGAVVLDALDDIFVCDLVVLCGPAPHAATTSSCVREGIPVVSCGDDLGDVRAMVALHETALERAVTVVVGAGMAPGLSGLVARMLADRLATVDELHIAVHGTAGPACARQHHDALGAPAIGWHDGTWIEPAGGSGRELVWFPEPIAAHDCYRAAVADPLLLHRAFTEVTRISARVSATRRDRLTARLPMLTPPHATGDLGAVRVEARGAAADGARETLIAGSTGAVGDLCAAVGAATALAVLGAPNAPSGVWSPGDAALADLDLLTRVMALGAHVQEFTGVTRTTSW